MTTLDTIITSILAISLVMNIVFWDINRALHSEVSAYKSQILQLRIDSEEDAKKTAAALTTAQSQMRQIQDKSNSILKEKVSNDCNKSIKWLVAQAKLL